MPLIILGRTAKFIRLYLLIHVKGTEALRKHFDAIHAPDELRTVLKANRKYLSTRRIDKKQWDLLYPPCGSPPNSKSFDITLLALLLRYICDLSPPKETGWSNMPVDTDVSRQAQITIIRLIRNHLSHSKSKPTQLDEVIFESLWQKGSKALAGLNIPQRMIDNYKTCLLVVPEEEIYVQNLKEPFLSEEDSNKNMLVELQQVLEYLIVQNPKG